MSEQVSPTVVLYIGESALAFDEDGEVLETIDYNQDGTPDWRSAGVCDHRGAGGEKGYRALVRALGLAEKNAGYAGYEITRLPTD